MPHGNHGNHTPLRCQSNHIQGLKEYKDKFKRSNSSGGRQKEYAPLVEGTPSKLLE